MDLGQHNQTFGKSGEDQACKYLEESGYEILERNFRCSIGEIDIIAQNGDEITFFEVKTRSNYNYGTPSEIINYAKLRRIEQVAWIYLRKIQRESAEWGIKIIEVYRNQCTLHDAVL